MRYEEEEADLGVSLQNTKGTAQQQQQRAGGKLVPIHLIFHDRQRFSPAPLSLFIFPPATRQRRCLANFFSSSKMPPPTMKPSSLLLLLLFCFPTLSSCYLSNPRARPHQRHIQKSVQHVCIRIMQSHAPHTSLIVSVKSVQSFTLLLDDKIIFF